MGALPSFTSSFCFGLKMKERTMQTRLDEQRYGKHGIIVFDGSCGACSTFIGRNKPFFEKYGFTVAPYQEAWVRELVGLDESTCSQAIHVRTNEGVLFRGVDFLQYFAGKIWWLVPVVILLRIKPLKPLYDSLAKRRRKISNVCGLQSRALYK